MSKKSSRSILLLVISLILFSLAAFAERQAKFAPAAAATVFWTGTVDSTRGDERLEYRASLGKIPAAKVSLESTASDQKTATNGRQGYQLRAVVETQGLAKALLGGIDYTSTVASDSMLPSRLVRLIKENGPNGPTEKQTETTFDQVKHIATVGEQKVPIAPKTYDVISLIYAMRSLDLKTGKPYVLAGLEGSSKFSVQVEGMGSESITTSTGPLKVIKVAIKIGAEAGSINDNYNIRAWFSDDERHLPVLITANPPFGAVHLDLKSINGSPLQIVESKSSDAGRR